MCGSALAAPKTSSWLEARSPHFVVVSNAGEEQARHVVLDFERVRTMLSRVLAGATVDVRQPVVVLAVDDERRLKEVLPQFWERRGQRPVAAYWGGPHQHHIVLRVDAAPRERYRRIVHEYMHLLMHANVPDLPAWLDEGLSEFWGAAVVQDGGVEVGQPAQHHLKVLRGRRPWIPLDELVAMDGAPDARDRRRLTLFYAQAWALAHYLILGGSPSDIELVPSKYIEALRQHEKVQAARSAFGSLPDLERSLRAYVRDGSFRAVRFEIPRRQNGSSEANSTEEVRVRSLPPAEALAVRARFLVDGKRSAAALPLLKEAVRLDSRESSALETFGYFHFQQNQPVEAARWFESAIASGSASYLAYYYRAILEATVPSQSPGDVPLTSAAHRGLARAEDYLRRAIDLNPAFAPAYTRLAGLYASEAGRLQDALPLLRRATELEPDFAVHWANLGTLLLQMDRPEDAREATKQGLALARSAGSRELFESLLLEIERHHSCP
jgi:tetratricopeptide (TPR) repeat protein